MNINKQLFLSIFFKTSICLLFLFITNSFYAQQYPWFTQNRSNNVVNNPGFCGTKRLIDFRLNYRNQWTGFEGSPKTYALSLNGRLLKGKLGLGGFLFKDEIGPFQNLYSAITAAFHLKFSDSELSFGIQGNYLSQKIIGSKITIRNQQDKAVDLLSTDKSGTFDGSFGMVYYNDRFHLALAANNLAGSKTEHYKQDSIKKNNFINATHYNLSAGYNFGDNPDFVFENNLFATFVNGVPPSFDYTLRLHMMKQLMAGFSLRFADAVALHLGYTYKDQLQVSYSYDIVTSPLRKYQSGSHEVKIVFSSNLGRDNKKRGLNGIFIRQKYQYIF